MSMTTKITCDLCPKACRLAEGQRGFCGARANENGTIKSLSYGKVVALALDPVEKKPLRFFHPGSNILSIGSFGCNMNCLFCQNHVLARAGVGDLPERNLSPDDLVELALKLKNKGNMGIAFTYNEPTINFEYVRDTFQLAREQNLETVLVTNGQINDPYLNVLLPLTRAWNIDLKSFSAATYRKLGGDLETTLNTIEKASGASHVEVTTLVVTGISDDLKEFEQEVDFIHGIDPDIPLHLSRYFPNYHYQEQATSIELMVKMQELAQKKLNHVILGNV